MKEFDDVSTADRALLIEAALKVIEDYHTNLKTLVFNANEDYESDFPFAEEKPSAVTYGPQRKGRGGKVLRW